MNVDPIARAYRWVEYAAFGRSLERCRFAQIDALPQRTRVLILGEGDGRFLERFMSQQPDARVDVFEISRQMILLAAARLPDGARSRVSFFQVDAVIAEPPSASYDLVVTNFVLDCLSRADTDALVSRVARLVPEGGLWLVSEFQKPETRLRRWHAEVWLRTMYLFFRIATGLRVSEVPDFARSLSLEGFTRVSERRQRLGLMVAQIWRKCG